MRILVIIIVALYSGVVYGQKTDFFLNSDTLNVKRYRSVLITESVAAIGSIALLNEVWYKQYPQAKLHAFDDSQEWLQLDKFGHATTAYYMGLSGIELMKWSGVKGAKRSLLGGSLGLVYLTGVEFLDGKSAQWGFSYSDVLANTIGAALVIGQDLGWQEQRFRLKISAHLTEYAKYRPNLLGSSFSERLLKDYNGQTIWLSGNIGSFLPKTSKFPKWLNLAVGIGGEEMISGMEGVLVDYNGIEISNDFQRYRQYYLSLDVDLTKIKTKQKWLKVIQSSFGLLKVPLPTLEFSQKGVNFHLLYF
ncbi:MAG: YfiM family protein [Flavobacteriales bacterium]|jgi:hypothetical protein|nr:YfiM family protein [Flavobacteriales bacterium]